MVLEVLEVVLKVLEVFLEVFPRDFVRIRTDFLDFSDFLDFLGFIGCSWIDCRLL